MLELVERITSLSNEQALEAAELLSGIELGAAPDEEVRVDVARAVNIEPAALQQAIDRAQPDEVAELARVVLIVHAAYRSPAEVEEAIAQTGRKAFLLEVAIVGLLALGLLHTIRSKGRKSETKSIRVEVEPDGKVTVSSDTKVTYFTVGETIGPIMGTLLKYLLPPGS